MHLPSPLSCYFLAGIAAAEMFMGTPDRILCTKIGDRRGEACGLKDGGEVPAVLIYPRPPLSR